MGWSAVQARCRACDQRYSIVDGIPVMIADGRHDGHQHQHHKQAQAAYFDAESAAEFEINRPNGAPALYQWMMREKFRHSLPPSFFSAGGHVPSAPLGADQQRPVLTVCGGSGMEAQFLAELGFEVVASDISLGAARRCQERARRFGLAIRSVVADVEHLPFRDRSIPLVYVHDGLHHLEDPMCGVAEMARVAGRMISITEPARAAVTAVGIRLGVSDSCEAAGNEVVRLQPRRIEATLAGLGFEVVRSERYAMFYRHHPGQAMHLFSSRPLLPVARGALRTINVLAGRWGNKLAVSGVRRVGAAGALSD